MSLTLITDNRREAAGVLAGKTGYSAIEYRGLKVSRAQAVAQKGHKTPCGWDISRTQAYQYLTRLITSP